MGRALIQCVNSAIWVAPWASCGPFPLTSETDEPCPVADFLKSLIIQAGGTTNVGLKRSHNEDSILVDEDLGLFGVADGMGGHAAGEVASRTAVQEILASVEQMNDEEDDAHAKSQLLGLPVGETVLNVAIRRANDLVCTMSEEDSRYFGMGTTVALFYFDGEECFIAHVGDSRIYRFRDNALAPMTEDHSWVNEQLRKNIITEEQARTHRWRNVITRALGNRSEIEIESKKIEPRDGDIYFICSDGLTSMVDDKAIEERLQAIDLEDLDAAANELIQIANEAGGLDNISVVMLRIREVEGNGSRKKNFSPDQTRIERHANETQSDGGAV